MNKVLINGKATTISVETFRRILKVADTMKLSVCDTIGFCIEKAARKGEKTPREKK